MKLLYSDVANEAIKLLYLHYYLFKKKIAGSRKRIKNKQYKTGERMEIRKAKLSEIDLLMDIYDHARAFMRQTGNTTQWIDGYPSREIITNDIAQGNSYVCLQGDEIVGVFCFFCGNDPTYDKIYDGEWLNDEPYGVIHRLASNGKVKGIAAFCFDWCMSQCDNIRVDTHQDNAVLQNILRKMGYSRCGIIYVSNGTPRIAFQKCKW